MVFLVVSRYRLDKPNRAHLDKIISISCNEIKGRKEGESSSPDRLEPLFFVLSFSLRYAANIQATDQIRRRLLIYYYMSLRGGRLLPICCNVCVSFHVMSYIRCKTRET